jgi:hypothetical protein
MAILGELDRAGKLHTDVPTVHAPTMKDALAKWDIAVSQDEAVKTFYMAGPAGIPTQVAFSQATRWPSLDTDRAEGCIRSYEHAFSKEGGLAVLTGNIALNGCVVKTAGVDDSILVFEGPAHVVESQDEAVANILADQVKAGDVVVVRYEGPKGGPGMQEMLYPTSYIKSKGLGKACALLTDGRFSGGTLATARPKRLLAARLAWSKTATASASTSPIARSTCWSATKSWPSAAPSKTPRAGSPRCRARARCRLRSKPMPSSSCRPTKALCATCRSLKTEPQARFCRPQGSLSPQATALAGHAPISLRSNRLSI